jgi:hypothetical protein
MFESARRRVGRKVDRRDLAPKVKRVIHLFMS